MWDFIVILKVEAVPLMSVWGHICLDYVRGVRVSLARPLHQDCEVHSFVTSSISNIASFLHCFVSSCMWRLPDSYTSLKVENSMVGWCLVAAVKKLQISSCLQFSFFDVAATVTARWIDGSENNVRPHFDEIHWYQRALVSLLLFFLNI